MNGAHKGAIARHAIAALGAMGALLLGRLSWADGVPNHVRDIKVHAADGVPGGTEIEVFGTVPPVYNARAEDGGKRLILDLTGADVVGAPEAITSPTGIVGGVLTRGFKTEAGAMARVSVSLLKPAGYRVRADGTTLHMTFAPADAKADDKAPPSATPQASVVEPEVREVRFERVAPGAGARDKCPNGCDRIIVDLSAIPSYALSATPSGHVRLEMRGTSVADAASHTLDLASYKSPLRKVATFHDGTSGAAIVELDRSGDAPGNLVVDGSKLIWSFDLPAGTVAARGTGAATSGRSGARVVTVARDAPLPDIPRVETSIQELDDKGGDGSEVQTAGGGEAGFTSTLNGQNIGGRGHFTGRRIDLDLKDADIHNILRLLADVGHVNIVTADDVSGNVTIRMRNVPWDQALDVVLQAKGLGMVRAGNLIRVAPAAQLNKERELRLAALKQEFELTPLETRLIPISYSTAEEMEARAKDLLSPRGSLSVDERTNMLIARDISGNLDNIEQLIRSLDTQTPQVLVEARIVEATSKYLRDVGIQWGGDISFTSATGNPTGIAFPSDVSAVGGNYDQNSPTAGLSPFTRTIPNPNFAVNLPAATGTGAGGALGLNFGSIDNTIHLNTRLSAAESNGLVRIVSAPRVLTLNNREARINQGTLIPFAQISAQGVQTTFQEAKLQLLVRPHVTADGSVAMHVKINRDEPDFTQTSARGDPTILKREAETDLLVMDGHTAVIGGIFTRNTGRNLDQVPFFGDIPILGVLFQRRRASDSRNELVIFLTPRIVNRAEALGR
jgi:type IV pilus assembly protein PilQ